MLKNAIVLDPKSAATSSFIFLHGLGDSGHGWADIWRQRMSCLFPQTRIICPNAPSMPVTINQGVRMPAWYDIAHLGTEPTHEDSPGMLSSAKLGKSLFINAI